MPYSLLRCSVVCVSPLVEALAAFPRSSNSRAPLYGDETTVFRIFERENVFPAGTSRVAFALVGSVGSSHRTRLPQINSGLGSIHPQSWRTIEPKPRLNVEPIEKTCKLDNF